MSVAKMRGRRDYWEHRYESNWDQPFHGMSGASDEFMQREYDGIRATLEPILKPHHRVLDAGCGYGRIAPLVCPHVAEYVGVDFSEKAIAQAAYDAPDNATYLAADIVDFTDEPFDVILMVGVASSVHYRPDVIEHLQTLLTDDGVILVLEYGDDRVIRKC